MRQKDIDNLKKLVELAPGISLIYLFGDMSDLSTKPIISIVANKESDVDADTELMCDEFLCSEYNMYENGLDDISMRLYFKSRWVPEYLQQHKYKLVYSEGRWFI